MCDYLYAPKCLLCLCEDHAYCGKELKTFQAYILGWGCNKETTDEFKLDI